MNKRDRLAIKAIADRLAAAINQCNVDDPEIILRRDTVLEIVSGIDGLLRKRKQDAADRSRKKEFERWEDQLDAQRAKIAEREEELNDREKRYIKI